MVHAKSLWIIKDQDRGMTTDRIARYETLRARVRTTSSKGPRRLFVDRGTWGDQRGLRNREEVLAALVAHGFEAIYPERMTVDEMSAAMSSAIVS